MTIFSIFFSHLVLSTFKRPQQTLPNVYSLLLHVSPLSFVFNFPPF